MSMRQLKITQSITSRESASLEKYLQEISKIDRLSPEEETALTILIKKGDKDALEKLIKANLRFVVSVAKQYQGQGLQLVDLINEGNIGLIKAAERFDDTRGFKFISFGVWWIRQNILQALADKSKLVRVPLNRTALSYQIRKAQTALEQRLERMPSEEEVAEDMNIDVEEVMAGMTYHEKHVSLDAPTNEEQDSNLLDVMENPAAAEANTDFTVTQSLKTEITRTLQTLPERQRETICYFFGIGVDHPMNLDDIARKFDLTTERVRQIKDKALSKLRNTQNFNLLRSFLGA